jgi:hypothetical protein
MGNFLERGDVFGYSHRIALNNRDYYRTSLGGIVTFLIKACIIY